MGVGGKNRKRPAKKRITGKNTDREKKVEFMRKEHLGDFTQRG